MTKIKKMQKKLKKILTLNTKFVILISRCVRKDSQDRKFNVKYLKKVKKTIDLDLSI